MNLLQLNSMMNIFILYIDESFEEIVENLINKVQEKSDEEEPCSICIEIFHEK